MNEPDAGTATFVIVLAIWGILSLLQWWDEHTGYDRFADPGRRDDDEPE